jgi:hypothetical protein
LCQLFGHFAALVALVVGTAAPAQPKAPASWFVQAGADGDGSSAERPAGSLEAIERQSGEGDRIFVTASDVSLDGGIALKPGQRLIGIAKDGRKPVITNTSLARNQGCGILLANASRVSNMRIEASFASGIYGRNVTGVRIDGVDVSDANRSQGFIDTAYPTLPGAVPHGGVVLVNGGSAAVAEVTASTVTSAAGFGIASITSGTANTRLVVRQTRVEGGSRIGFFDIGIAALVKDAGATTRLEVSDSVIKGRLSRSGRNAMIAAAGGGRADARFERVVTGATGQDGIVGAVMQSPSEITIYIGDSVIEDAGQMNVEGSLLNLPPEGAARADAASVSIEIERTIIRNAGAVPGHEDIAANVWLGGSQWIKAAPPATGRYTLKILDSRIEGAGGSGLELGTKRILASGLSETSLFDVVLRGSTIANNGEADVKIYAPGARIDARQNCWGRPEGLAEDRVLLFGTARRAQLDATEPLPCNS